MGGVAAPRRPRQNLDLHTSRSQGASGSLHSPSVGTKASNHLQWIAGVVKTGLGRVVAISLASTRPRRGGVTISLVI